MNPNDLHCEDTVRTTRFTIGQRAKDLSGTLPCPEDRKGFLPMSAGRSSPRNMMHLDTYLPGPNADLAESGDIFTIPVRIILEHQSSPLQHSSSTIDHCREIHGRAVSTWQGGMR